MYAHHHPDYQRKSASVLDEAFSDCGAPQLHHSQKEWVREPKLKTAKARNAAGKTKGPGAVAPSPELVEPMRIELMTSTMPL